MAESRDLLSGQATVPLDALAPTIATPGGAPAPLSGSQPAPVDPAPAPLDDVGFAERYATRTLLGAGGMGEVHLVKDQRIGREVAVKVARGSNGSRGDAVARFAREARVQGQLEHPAIVPVYDLGRRSDGAVFFTMKRVRGVTLEQILHGLRSGDQAAARGFSRRKLLTAFGQVCQAVHFAHTRGVLHRDLKPSNVMLGDFGEVYVLDWGLAKLTAGADEDLAPLPVERVERVEGDVSSTPAGATTSGAIMGTPGYMSPEQIRGEIDQLDAHTDVYALGAMLFEILTLEPLHARPTMAQAMASTLEGADARASVRYPAVDVPPELEAACVRATATDPKARYASTRELHEAVERFLDGDRDLARRRELAAEWASAAEQAVEQALADTPVPEAREQALQHAGRALALDPRNPGAMRALVKLLLAPPKQTPPEVLKELEQSELATLRVAGRKGAMTYLSWFLFVPFVFWLGVKDTRPLVAWLMLVATCVGLTYLGSRFRSMDWRMHFMALVTSSLTIMVMSPMLGPFVLVPIMASVNTIAFLLHSRPAWRLHTFVIGALTMLLPVIAELAGIVPRTTFFENDAMVVRSWSVHLPAVPSMVVLCAAIVAMIIIPGIYVLRVRDSLMAAERRLHLQSWHLRQLLPAEARDALVQPDDDAPPPLISCPIDAWYHAKRT